MTRGRHAADKMPDLITDYTGARRPAHRAQTRGEVSLAAEFAGMRVHSDLPETTIAPRPARQHVNVSNGAEPLGWRA